MASYLFVHGAFQGAWVWQSVAEQLRCKKHDVHTPTLPGCGYLAVNNRQSYDLQSYIAAIIQYIEEANLTSIVLVGHSYSGMICGAVMARVAPRISRAIFIDAVLPEVGHSFAQLAGAPFLPMLEKHRNGDVVYPWPLPVFGVNGEDAGWFESRLRPFPYRAFIDAGTDQLSPQQLPVTYISCKQTITPFIKEMAVRAKEYGWKLSFLESGHCPMVTHPAELVRLLLD